MESASGRPWRLGRLTALLAVLAVGVAIATGYSLIKALLWLFLAQFIVYSLVLLALGRHPRLLSADSDDERPQSPLDIRLGAILMLLFGCLAVLMMLRTPSGR
jgi:hypothetical protein